MIRPRGGVCSIVHLHAGCVNPGAPGLFCTTTSACLACVMYNKARRAALGKRRCFMVARGHVQNGVVVLDGGVHLPEGLEVTVVTPDRSASLKRGQGTHSVLDIPSFSVGEII